MTPIKTENPLKTVLEENLRTVPISFCNFTIHKPSMKGGRPKLSSHGICKVSIASVRFLASHKSHLVTQALFGEHVKILSKKKGWYRVECLWDGIIGWVDPKQFHTLKEKEIPKLDTQCNTYTLDHFYGLNSGQHTIPITLGSNLDKCDGINVKLPFGRYEYNGQIVNLNQSRGSQKLLIKIAKKYLHCPHLFGGRSILGVDPAGFIQVVYKLVGIQLPRYCQEQSLLGTDIGFLEHAVEGDLAFFDSGDGHVDHVGIVMEDSKILHVYGQVRLDPFDQQGIYNKNTKRYIFKMRTIKRML